jgi:outer membrane receptor for ferric coprogen and ferric-rhodotorulic acid
MRRHLALACTTLVATGLALPRAGAAEATQSASGLADQTLAEVKVTAAGAVEPVSERTRAYRAKRNTGATGLDLSTRDTPQSVSVATRALMDDFNLNNINAVLDTITGVTVERVETDRTYFTARGFDVTNFQVDGIGLPLYYGLLSGDLDTAIYDRIEVIRGATGLMAGTGNPSATVNFIRKRPTAEFQGQVGISYGSWNNLRMDSDVSSPINSAGTLRGRLTLAAQDRDSYLDRYHGSKTVINGILEADVGENTLLTVGHTRQENKPKGLIWGALPLSYTDGSATDYDVSTSTSARWSYWNTTTQTTFAELSHAFASGWQGKLTYSHKEIDSDSKLLYVYGTPDRATGNGLFAWPSVYTESIREDLVDLRANGPFTLGGRTHEAVVGAFWSRSRIGEQSVFGSSLYAPFAGTSAFDGSLPEPVFNIPGGGSNFTDRQRSAFATVRFNPADAWKLILGANLTTVESSGTSYGVDQSKSESNTTPYAGVTYALTPATTLYASHTAIFKPQVERDPSLNRLDPVRGTNSEIGLKTDLFGGKALGTVALFRTRQENLASQVGSVGPIAVYEGVDTRSRGVELELAGEVADGLKLTAGYTTLSIDDEAGGAARTFIPRRQLRLSTTYTVPAEPRLKVGGTLNARSETHVDLGSFTARQAGYAILGLMAHYDVDARLSLGVNLNNVTDRKYLTSLYWSQSYYAEPRNVSVNATWKF